MDESVANPRSEANLRCCFLKRRFAAMAEKFRLTCWQNWNEWVSVYEKIYSFGDQEIQAEGLRLIDIWRSRSEGKTPLAIECTAGLVAADIGLLGQTTRGLSLAMALVRFVNGMVDQGNPLEFCRIFSISRSNSLHRIPSYSFFLLIKFPVYCRYLQYLL